MSFKITDLKPTDQMLIQQAAQILVDAFAENWPNSWPDLDDALAEVQEALAEGKICRIALDADGNALGWIGGLPEYDGHTWELHPLAVAPGAQGMGVGRGLVEDFEALVHERGATTIMLGSDDENNMTSLSGVDLYQNTWEHIAHVRNFKGHPYSFYQKMGFVIVGVIPDASGPGKPDILMAKRISRS